MHGRRALLCLACSLIACATADAQQDQVTRQLYAANGLANRGLCDLAITEYRAFLDAAPDHELSTLARYGLAACLAQSDDGIAEATELLGHVVRQRGFEFLPDAMLLRAQTLLALDRFDDAQQQAAAFLDRFDDHERAGEAAALNAEALYRAGAFEPASSAGRDAAERGGAWAWRAAMFAGLADTALGEDQRAARVLESAFEGAPSDADRAYVALLIAQARHRLAEPQALSAYERVIAFGPTPSFAPALHGAAQLHLSAQRFAEARAMAQQLVAMPLDQVWHARAGLILGRAALGMGELDAASAALSGLIADNTPELTRDAAAFWLARVRAAQGDHAGAVALLEHAIDRAPDSTLKPEMNYDRAIALANAGRAADAIEALRRFADDFEPHELAPSAAAAEARLLYDASQYADALDRCEQWLGRYAGHARTADVELLRAESLYLLGKTETAASAYEDWLDQHTDNPERDLAALRLGLCLYDLGDDESAHELLQRVADRAADDPTYRAAWLALGEIAFDAERWPEARDRLARYADFQPAPASLDAALLKLGLAHEKLGAAELAAQALRAVLATHTDSPSASHAAIALARVLEATGDTTAAEGVLRAFVERSPNDALAPPAMRRLGQFAHADGRLDQAAAWYQRAIDSSDDASAATLDLARARLAMGRNAEALDALGNLSGLDDRQQAAAEAMRLIALGRLGEHKQAADLAERALRDDARTLLDRPLHRLARFETARALLATQQPEPASRLLALLLAEPDRDEVRLYAAAELAALASESGDHARALDLARTVLDSERPPAPPPARERALYLAGVSHWRTEEHTLAEVALRLFGEEFPESELAAPAALLRADALLALRRRDDAIAPLTLASRAADPEIASTATLRLGETFADLQRWSDSLSAFESHLRAFPDHALAYQARFGAAWAMEHLDRGDDAIALYRRVTDEAAGPTAARAQFQIGQCLFAQGQLEAAARELLRVDLLYAHPEWSAAALCEAGKCFEQLGRARDARAQYQRVVAEHAGTDWAAVAAQRLSALLTDARAAGAGGGD